jgi:hypothetical protein
MGQIAFTASHWCGGDVEKVLWAMSGNQGTCIDEGLTRARGGPNGDESGHEPSVVGDAEFLASFNPGEVSRCVLS